MYSICCYYTTKVLIFTDWAVAFEEKHKWPSLLHLTFYTPILIKFKSVFVKRHSLSWQLLQDTLYFLIFCRWLTWSSYWPLRVWGYLALLKNPILTKTLINTKAVTTKITDTQPVTISNFWMFHCFTVLHGKSFTYYVK